MTGLHTPERQHRRSKACLAGSAVAQAVPDVDGQQPVDEVAALGAHLVLRRPLDAPVQDVIKDLLP